MNEKRVRKLFVEELEKRIAPASLAKFADKVQNKVDQGNEEWLHKKEIKFELKLANALANGNEGRAEVLAAKLALVEAGHEALHGDGKGGPYGGDDGGNGTPLLSSLDTGEDAGTGR